MTNVFLSKFLELNIFKGKEIISLLAVYNLWQSLVLDIADMLFSKMSNLFINSVRLRELIFVEEFFMNGDVGVFEIFVFLLLVLCLLFERCVFLTASTLQLLLICVAKFCDMFVNRYVVINVSY